MFSRKFAVSFYDVVAFHHISRTGGAALVRRLYESKPAAPWTLRTAWADSRAEGEILADKSAWFENDAKLLCHSHFAFGFHKFLRRPVAYFSVIRQPVARILSEFYWHYGIELAHLTTKQIVVMLESYIDRYDHYNFQTFEMSCCAQDRRMPLSLAHPDNLRDDPSVCFVQAIENIEELFLYIGCTETPEATHAFLETSFGFKKIDAGAVGFNNASAARFERGGLRRQDIPASLLQKLHSRSAYDRELYDMVRLGHFEGRSRRHPFSGQDDFAADTLPSPLKFVCRPNVPWRWFVEGMLGIGALPETDDAGAAGRLWKLSFRLPVALTKQESLAVRLSIGTPPTYRDGTNSLDIAITIGDDRKPYATFTKSTTVTHIVAWKDIKDGFIPFQFVSKPVAVSAEANIERNPLPYMIEEIVISPFSRVGFDETVRFGETMPAILIEGWNKPHPDFVWTIRKTAVIAFDIDTSGIGAGIIEAMSGIDAILELTVDPLVVPGRVDHQEVVFTIAGQTSPAYVVDKFETLRFPFVLPAGLLDGPLKIGMTLPRAHDLASLGLNTDAVNELGLMVHSLRLVLAATEPQAS